MQTAQDRGRRVWAADVRDAIVGMWERLELPDLRRPTDSVRPSNASTLTWLGEAGLSFGSGAAAEPILAIFIVKKASSPRHIYISSYKLCSV